MEEEGGWYEKSKKEGVSLEKERKRELWADPYGELACVFPPEKITEADHSPFGRIQ